jgi:GT2 family glycosyltransferase
LPTIIQFTVAGLRAEMPLLTIVSLGLGIILLLQSAWSLLDGFRFLYLVRRAQGSASGRFTPRVGLVIPCKGTDPFFPDKLNRFLNQCYPNYDGVFVVASTSDPAYALLQKRLAQLASSEVQQVPAASLVVAGFTDTRGEKTNNLLHGIARLRADVEVMVFADSDAFVGNDWLVCLVAPLAHASVTVSTGFRWYLPGRGFASQLRAAWDTSIATLLDEHDPKFAWGGSMAIRAADFRRLGIAERWWADTVSDDYTLTCAVREAGERIVFEPRCLVVSREELSFAEFLRWTSRQIILTRLYAPHLWLQGLAAHALYGATFVFGGVTLLGSQGPLLGRGAIAVLLVGILLLGVAKGWTRSLIARERFSEEMPGPKRLANRYWQLAPLVPWVMLWNFMVAGFARWIEWCGTKYRVNSRGKVIAVTRDAG